MPLVTTTSAGGNWKILTGTKQEILDGLDALGIRHGGQLGSVFVDGAGFSVFVRNSP